MMMTPESLEKCKQEYMQPCNNYWKEWVHVTHAFPKSKKSSSIAPVFARTEGTEGWHGLMCPKCFNVVYRRVHYVSSSMVENSYVDRNDPEMMIVPGINFVQKKCYGCWNEYFEPIQLDYNIAATISLLNKAGYTTKYCCEGHGKPDTYAYIMFDGNKIMKYLNALPITWEVDLDTIRENGSKYDIIIRSEACNYEEAIMDIYDWTLEIYNSETKKPIS